jgi:ankyrin repeat protein
MSQDTKERRNCLKIMDSLVQYGANIDCLVSEEKITPLMIVSSAGHLELVQWLLSKGANPNFPCPLNGRTALMLAAKYGHPYCIAELVRKKATINVKDVSLPDFLILVLTGFRKMETLLFTTQLSLVKRALQNSSFESEQTVSSRIMSVVNHSSTYNSIDRQEREQQKLQVRVVIL